MARSSARWPTSRWSTFKQRVRQLTRRSGGRSMAEVVERLRSYLLGMEGLLPAGANAAASGESWTSGCGIGLRAIQLKHWKRGKTMYRELRNLGAPAQMWRTGGGQQPTLVAQQRWLHQHACSPLPTSTGWAYPVSHDLNFSNRPVRTRMPGGVAGVGQLYWLPLCRFLGRASFL